MNDVVLPVRWKWISLVAVLAALGCFGWAVSLGWSHPLTDSHSSRQAQTAITAQLLFVNGFAPLTPFNGLGPPWDVPMEFPTYQVLAATLAHATGGNIVAAGRVASILGALALLPALWWLLRRSGLAAPTRGFALAMLLTAPLFAHYARAVLIETWASALALGWLAALVETLFLTDADARARRRWLLAAIVLGVIAALTKITSFAVVLPAGAILTLQAARSTSRATWIRAAAATVPGVLAGVWWTQATDAIKSAHPYADFLTSRALHDWNWGTLAQRLDPAWWIQGGRHLTLIAPAWAWAVVVLGFGLGDRRQRGVIALALLTLLTGPLAFANLYFVHDYYWMAVAPAVVVAVGTGLAALVQRWPNRVLSQIGATLFVAALLLSQIHQFRLGLGHGQVETRPPPTFAAVLRELTQPSDTLVVFGREWDPLLTFYTQRPMAGVRGTHETDNDAWAMSRAALAPADYTVLVAMDSVAGDVPFVQHRCRELGLLTDPIASTADADIYVNAATRDRLAPVLARLLAEGRILPSRPERMGPGESRVEMIAPDWHPLSLADAKQSYWQCEPYPDRVFAKYAPSQPEVDGEHVLHQHPPGGLHFNAVARDRTVRLDYGILPEIWEKERDTDGVRFRAYEKGPGDRTRLVWEDFVQPRTNPDDCRLLSTHFPLPAGHTLELIIDAGPDHNPGYDWSYLKRLQLVE